MSLFKATQKHIMETINRGPKVIDPAVFSGPMERVLLGMKAHANRINRARCVALEQSFVLTRQEMGDARFRALCRDYIDTDTAKALDLADIGFGFAAFIKCRGVDTATTELCAVEWARLESYHAADADALSLGAVGNMTNQDLLALTVAAHPAMRLVAITAEPCPALCAITAGKPVAAILLVRPKAEVHWVALDHATMLIANRCNIPITIGRLFNSMQSLPDNADALAALLTLIGAGALVAIGGAEDRICIPET
jgi:hypothetical protein